MRQFVAALLSLTLWIGVPGVARALDFDVVLHQFTWEERQADGRTMLEEEGPLLGLRLAGTSPVTPAVAWRNRGEVFLGEVDYDGATTLGQPLRTTTAYYGFKLESDLAWDLSRSDQMDTGPLAGLSARAWLRRLDHGARDSNGYDEGWFITYARLGWFASVGPADGLRVRAEAALRLPIYNTAHYSLTGADGSSDASVEPGGELSAEAALDLVSPRWRIGLAYEDFEFSESNGASLPPFEIFQPESEGRLLSLRVGVTF